MSKQPCQTCGGTTGFVNNRGTLDVCDDPWHAEHEQKTPERRKPPYTHRHIVTVQFENPKNGERWEGWSAHKTRELAERRVENCARETATRRRVSYSITSY